MKMRFNEDPGTDYHSRRSAKAFDGKTPDEVTKGITKTVTQIPGNAAEREG